MRQIELLAPAGSLSTLKAVVSAGADAVYFGGSKFSARAYADNLTKEEVLEAIDFGHIHGRKMMLAVNTLLKEQELEEELYDYLLPYYERGLDAVIVQDFGVMAFIREQFPGLPIHTSTQMTVTGAEGAKFLEKAGASRIVLARELSLEEIHTINQAVSAELECFVHGALCYCYSGQCLFSSVLGGRSGNRGRCAQPCRLPYEIGNRTLYPLSPKDLCAVSLLPKLIKNGVSSLKIEGRMKQERYAAGVVSVYRDCLDRYLSGKEAQYFVTEEEKKKLFDFGNRSGFTEGYYQKKNGPDMITFFGSSHERQKEEDGEQCVWECRAEASGSLTVQKNAPIRLMVSYGGTKVTVTGEIPTAAKNRPLTEETLREKLSQTKTTFFDFKELTIRLDEGLFCPLAAVKELRRRAFDLLTEACAKTYKRSSYNVRYEKGEQRVSFPKKQFFLSASAERREQIAPLLEHPSISLIYVDSSVFSREETAEGLKEVYEAAKARDKQTYYSLPVVFREHTMEFYRRIWSKIKADGFLAKSYDALGFLLEQKVDPQKIRIDYSVYTWSNRSKEAFFKTGIGGDTVSLELNRSQIRQRENAGSEMVIYGYLPLMVSAQCIEKNLFGCSKMPKIHTLKDRRRVSFPVKNHCNECYNVIYNSRPLQLFPAAEELKKFGVESFRFSFTIESGAQVENILKVYESGLPFEAEYTCGHYKRGVE